jgi:GNAT superfamily N-acetyltransferase
MTGLRKIWNACFPGEEAFGDYFFANLYTPERALTVTDGGQPVAMLCRFPRSLEVDGTVYPVHYIYAVSTLPEHRGRGHASFLMNRAAEEARREGIAALVIILQTPEVFPFYGRLGFEVVSAWSEEPAFQAGFGLRQAGEHDIPMLNVLYDERTEPKIRRGEADWKDILRTYDVQVGDGFYAVASEGRLRELSDGLPKPSSFEEATVIGCLLDLTDDKSLSGLSGAYFHLMHN